MCRVLIFIKRGKCGNSLLELIEGFKKASQKDPFLRDLSDKYEHSDGWGYILYVNEGKGLENIYYYKSLRPVFRDDQGFLMLKSQVSSSEVIFGLIHSRLAGNEPVDLVNTQPLHGSTVDGWDMWLIHNGSINKNSIAEYLGLKNIKIRRSDTYFLLKYLTLHSSNKLLNALRYLIKKNYVRTALNLGLLLTFGNKVKLVITTYSVKVTKAHLNYYEMYKIREECLTVFTSSTIAKYYLPKNLKAEVLPNGHYVELNMCEDLREGPLI